MQTLLTVFQTLIESGATVIVIEHDLDVIRSADYILDMGPGGGEAGGRLVACGTLEQIDVYKRQELHDVVNELYVDDAADMIEEMPANLVKRILRHTDAETRVLINQILNYPKDSAGSIMTMEYVDLKRGMTAVSYTHLSKKALP